MKSMRYLVTGAAFAAIAAGWSGAAVAQETVTVWFTKGFYKGEDDALLAGTHGDVRGLVRRQPGCERECEPERPREDGADEQQPCIERARTS